MAIWTNLLNTAFGRTPPANVSPTKTSGVRGTAIFSGYVENIEKDASLVGTERYRTASEMLANISIVGAGLRFFLNLCAKPNWAVEPAEDLGDGKSSDAAKAAAEFVESVLYDMETNWARVVRRAGLFRFHGFGIQEWTAKRRNDGMIGMADIEPRPCHTIERWEVDPKSGRILGVWQRNPNDGSELWLPRSKVVYVVDDALTDSPEGMGLFRHLAEPAEYWKFYRSLERLGFQRDLRGIPIGRAPVAEINALVENKTLTQAEADKMLDGLKRFVKMQVKAEDTGLILDSTPYTNETEAGETQSAQLMWGLELLSAEGGSFEQIGKAIERINLDMARIIGVEGLVLGDGSGGSRALSTDKSKNLYLNVNSTVGDLSEAFERDVIGPLWRLNGLPDELKPTLKPEDVSPKDVEQIAQTLKDMATAGAVLAPDDPAIDDVRDLLGVSRQPEVSDAELALRRAEAAAAAAGKPGAPGAPPEKPVEEQPK